MRRKPEKRVELFLFKCLIDGCKKPYGLVQTLRSVAEMNWFYHALRFHQGKIREIPAYLIKTKKFKAVKD